jgi:hypothetical protein
MKQIWNNKRNQLKSTHLMQITILISSSSCFSTSLILIPLKILNFRLVFHDVIFMMLLPNEEHILS